MSRTLTLRLAALTVAIVLVLGTGSATAATNHSVSAAGKVALIGTEGGRSVVVGRFLGSIGETLAVLRTKALANGNLSSTFRAFNAKGTLAGTVLQTVTKTPSGGTTFSGTVKITGGTGLYKGATGKLSAAGTQAKGATVVSYKLKGSIRY